jgi:hypothetical protein
MSSGARMGARFSWRFCGCNFKQAQTGASTICNHVFYMIAFRWKQEVFANQRLFRIFSTP